jgi:polyisoprenoid-binding protein YceI
MSDYLSAKCPVIFRLIALAIMVVSARSTSAGAQTFTIDPARSSVVFEIRHVTSTVTGTFSRFEGEFTVDRDRPEHSAVTFTIEVTSLATDDSRRTARLNRDDFFATSRFPTIRFQSTRWKIKPPADYEITGDLTIKGVTKPLVVHVKPPHDSGQWAATAKLDRRHFGVSGGPPGLIGNEVDVRISLEGRAVGAPSTMTSVGLATMVSRDEPGERLVLRGTVYEADGTTPVSGAKLYVYHTDGSGKYSIAEAGVGDERNARLQSRLATDAQGRFEIQTILPGPYPGGKTPRHIHIMVTAPGGTEHNATFQFANDPNLTPKDYQRHGQDGTFSGIRPAERGADGMLYCVRDIRLRSVRR